MMVKIQVRAFPSARRMPAGDRALETVLHQIVRRGTILHQRPRVAAQRGNQRLDQTQHVVHRL
jgi:hypothetical protein